VLYSKPTYTQLHLGSDWRDDYAKGGGNNCYEGRRCEWDDGSGEEWRPRFLWSAEHWWKYWIRLLDEVRPWAPQRVRHPCGNDDRKAMSHPRAITHIPPRSVHLFSEAPFHQPVWAALTRSRNTLRICVTTRSPYHLRSRNTWTRLPLGLTVCMYFHVF